ncbi:MAG: glycosyltransferase family 2 protein [Candidatus Undinarchaeales archaeon]|nr:glycosyltransferase family 2 protein [Candidatus Undinarchaeales archaeon]MDP7492922.1 glycosyltransferase family 2 protein [Candidatus Undinarchaeales archaeon]
MGTPLFSVIIPSMDNSDTLEKVLGALVRSTFKDFEIIIVHEGVLEPHLLADHKGIPITVLRTDGRLGAGHARNIGAKKAQGEVLLFLDADVKVTPDTLQMIKDDLENKDISAVQTVYSKDCPVDNFASQYRNIYERYMFDRIDEKYIQAASTHCFAVRKDQFIAFDDDLLTAEDDVWGFRLYKKGLRILLDKGIEVIHLRKFTLSSMLKRSLMISRYKAISVKHYREQVQMAPKASHHHWGKLLGVVLSPVPPLFWIVNIGFFGLVYREKGLGFLMNTVIFHELNFLMFLCGIIWGLIC